MVGGKNPVVSLCTYSFEKNCDLNLSQMAVVRLKIKIKSFEQLHDKCTSI